MKMGIYCSFFLFFLSVYGGWACFQSNTACVYCAESFRKGVSIGALYRTCGEINSERFNAIPLLPSLKTEE